MGYIYLLLIAVMFSFGGSCVKLISPYIAPSMISCLRFLIGVGFLLVLKALLKKPFRGDLKEQVRRHWKWLVFGALSKLSAYITENTALALGVSYGNILTQPVQVILLAVISVTILREKLSAGKLFGIVLCILGILSISWNGRTIENAAPGSFLLTGLFVFSGVSSGLFMCVQKRITDDFDILDSNLIMFTIAGLIGLIVPAAEGNLLPHGVPDWRCVLAMLLFGFITGIGFYLNAKAIPLVPFYMVPILQSAMVFFTILWGVLFFHEPVSIWILGGTVVFVLGIVISSWPAKRTAA